MLVKLFIFLAGGKTLDEFGPGLIGLAGKQYVAQAVEEGFIHGSVSPANDREDPHFTERSQDLPHAIPLDYHSRYTDNIKPFEELEVDFLDVFVEKTNLMVRHQTGEMRKCSRGHRTLLVPGIEWQRIVEAPIRGLKLRIDETNFQSLHGECEYTFPAERKHIDQQRTIGLCVRTRDSLIKWTATGPPRGFRASRV